MSLTPSQRKEARLALGFPTIGAWAKHIGRGRERIGLWEAGTIEPPAMYDMLIVALADKAHQSWLENRVTKLEAALMEIKELAYPAAEQGDQPAIKIRRAAAHALAGHEPA